MCAKFSQPPLVGTEEWHQRLHDTGMSSKAQQDKLQAENVVDARHCVSLALHLSSVSFPQPPFPDPASLSFSSTVSLSPISKFDMLLAPSLTMFLQQHPEHFVLQRDNKIVRRTVLAPDHVQVLMNRGKDADMDSDDERVCSLPCPWPVPFPFFLWH